LNGIAQTPAIMAIVQARIDLLACAGGRKTWSFWLAKAVDKGSGKLAVIALVSIVEKQRVIAVTAGKKLIANTGLCLLLKPYSIKHNRLLMCLTLSIKPKVGKHY